MSATNVRCHVVCSIGICVSVAESWIHCNDARMERCALSDVMTAQAYILFYMQLDEPAHSSAQDSPQALPNDSLAAKHSGKLNNQSTGSKNTNSGGQQEKEPKSNRKDTMCFTEVADEEITFNFRNSSVPQFKNRKRASEGGRGHRAPLKRRKTLPW